MRERLLVLSLLVIAELSGASRALAGAPALQVLADELDRKLSAAMGEDRVPVVAVAVECDESIMGRGDRLAQELERLLVFRLEHGVAVEKAIPVGAGSARDLARLRALGASLLVRCVLGVELGRVQATVDLKSLHVPFWDRLVDPVPRGSRQHIFASVQADEEVTLLLGRAKAPPALESWHVSELLSIPEHVIDLGLGDLDGDGRAELVVLQEDRIEVFELAEGRARKLASHQVGSIPEAAIRTRDPNGSLLVVDFNRDGQFEVFYKLFNRRYGQVLTWTGAYLKEVRRLDSVPICLLHRDKRPVVVYARPETGTNRYGPEIEVADINSARGKTYRLPSAFLSFRCWQGREGDAVAIASSAGGRLIRLDSGFKPQKVDEPAGVGLAVLDLDMDSVPEMVLSDPVWPGEPDSVRVLSGDQTVWRSRDVIGGIVSVAGGDLDGRGKVQAVLAAVDPGGQSSRIYLLGR